MRWWQRQDAVAGWVFIGVALGFGLAAADYPLGSNAAPGPGRIPLGLCTALAVIGLMLLLRSAKAATPALRVLPIALRPMACVLAAILLFALLLEPLGLLLTVPLVTACVSLADGRLRPLEWLLTAIGIALGCWLLFVWGLGLPLPVWPAQAPWASAAA